MSILWTGVRVAAVAFALSASFAATASADDLIAQCKTGMPVPDADKICKCMSDKITPADRGDVIEAMTKANAAMAKGTTATSADLTPKVMKGLETAMNAQAQCM